MGYLPLSIDQQRRKQGYIPDLQPRWCKYCEYLEHNVRERERNNLTSSTNKKQMVNLSCKKGCFSVRPSSSCNEFELKEE